MFSPAGVSRLKVFSSLKRPWHSALTLEFEPALSRYWPGFGPKHQISSLGFLRFLGILVQQQLRIFCSLGPSKISDPSKILRPGFYFNSAVPS